jgi:hypothetical protein
MKTTVLKLFQDPFATEWALFFAGVPPSYSGGRVLRHGS